MRNYLSQIVARANGISESTPMKPGIRSWPPSYSEESSSPFEEAIEPTIAATTPQSPPGQTDFLENTNSFMADQSPEMMVSPGLLNSKRSSSLRTPGQFMIPLEQPARSSSDGKNKSVNVDQPSGGEKPNNLNNPVSRATKRTGKVIFDSENPAPVRPVFVETNVTHEQFVKQDRHAELSLKEERPKIRQPDEPPVESLKHSSPGPLTPGAQVSFSRKTEETNQSTNVPVSELRPRPPNNVIPFPVSKMENKEPRIVIGRLKVEVVPPPVTTKHATVRTTTPHTVKPQPRREVSNSHYKLRFGLGQM